MSLFIMSSFIISNSFLLVIILQRNLRSPGPVFSISYFDIIHIIPDRPVLYGKKSDTISCFKYSSIIFVCHST